MPTIPTLYVKAAYGRQYLSRKAVIQDWMDGRDFRIIGGPYMSRRDIPYARKDGYTGIEFRDGRLSVTLPLD